MLPKDIISSLVLFSTSPQDVIDIVASKAELIDVETDHVLFDEHDNSQHVYFVIDGNIRIFIESKAGDVALADFGRGSCFGELAALDGNMRSGKAVAIEQTKLIRLDHATFNKLIQSYAEVANAVIRRLIETIRRADLRVSEISALSESARLGRELIRLSKPADDAGYYHIPKIPSHAELSQKTSVPLKQVPTVFGALMKEGVIARSPKSLKTLFIKDMIKLKSIAEMDE